MSEQLFSPSWYRVADLRPKVKDQADVRRQEYRGELWYVIYDQVTGKSHRLTTAAYSLLGLLDGRTTVHQAWDASADILGDELPTQDEVIQLLATLHRADLLHADRSPDLHEMQERYSSQIKSQRLKRFINPLFLRFKLFDPERLLQAMEPVTHWIFNRWAAGLWLVVVATALISLGAHWREFTEGMADRLLSADNLLVMVVVFPIIKVFHELGHALAVKKWGGEVHDIGLMLLVFMPVPYVDASSSWSFREKYHRIIVSAAGMLVEIFLASLALLLWGLLEPGLLRSLVYNAVFIAGVSTVLFNANPLLRFDGYYILMDWLEIPNLGARANKYFLYLCRRYLFGMPRGDLDWGDVQERRWLVFYAAAAFLYRLFLTLAIAVFVAGKFLVVGILLACWALTMSVLMPLAKLIRYLLWGPELRRYRKRALRVSAAISFVAWAMVFFIPMPFFTISEGVVWIPEDNHLRAGSGGFVADVHAHSGDEVMKGDLLLVLQDPELHSRLRVLEYRLEGYMHNYRAQRVEDKLEAEIVKDEMRAVEKELDNLLEKIARLKLRAPVDGTLVLARENDLPGRYFPKGQLVGYVVKEGNTTVRVAVEQHEVGLVRQQLREIDVRFASDLFTEHPANIIREIPGATDQLPSLALTAQGGGKLANAPTNSGTATSYQQVFLFDLGIELSGGKSWSGERVHVRFDYGYAPLWQQWHRRIRQLFLRLSTF